jgi:hypothetical protein
MMLEAMWKVLGPIDKELDSEKMILTSAEERRAKESQKEPYHGNSDQGSQAAASSKRGRSPKLMKRNSKRPEREVPRETKRKVRREPRDRRDRSPEPEEEGKNLRKDKEKTQKPASAGLRQALPGGWSEAALRAEDIERYPEEEVVGAEIPASSSSEYETSDDEATAPGLKSAPKASARKAPSSSAAASAGARHISRREPLKQQSAAVVATQKRQPAAADPKKLEKSKETLLEAAHRKTQGMMLHNDDIQVMVEKWQKWQGAFSDYVLKPCCIHIILEDRVKCLNVWSGSVEEPVNKKLMKQTFVVGASASSSGTPAAKHIGDWTMAEVE